MSASDRPDLPGQVVLEHFQLLIPSLPHWIEAAADFLRQRAVLCGACDESRSGKLLVALHEAMANAIIHGNLQVSSDLKEKGDDSFARVLAARAGDPLYSSRFVDVRVDYDGSWCRWTITDEGPGFDVPAVLARCMSEDPEVLLASGRGILMMRSFLDEVRYEQEGRRLLLALQRDSGRERRVKPRVQRSEALHVVPLRPDGSADWESAYHAVARNFCPGGIGLLQETLAQADRILIGLNAGGKMVYIPAQVRHVHSVSGNLVELGCAFLPEDQAGALPGGESSPEALDQVHLAIDQILGRGLAVPHDERRLHPRVVYNERVEAKGEGQSTTVVGYARDLSRGGLSMITTAPLALEGATLALPRPGGTLLRVRGQVVRCTRLQDNFYDVGIRFLGLK